MSGNITLSLAAAQAQAQAVAPLANNGFLAIYGGERPATPETAPGSEPLVIIDLPDPFAAAIIDGVITARSLPETGIATSGVATWFRVLQADASTPVCDGDAGTAAPAALVLASTVLAAGTFLLVGSFTLTVPGA